MHLIKLAALTTAIAALALSAGGAAGQQPAPAEAAAVAEVSLSGEALDGYVLGNIYFLAYHEFGHALVSEFEVPIPGREEDAVDRLATWMMTPDPDEEGEAEYLTAAIGGWFMAASEKSLDQIAWWGQHGTDVQRGFQIACLLFGEDPKRFKGIADIAGIPPDRRPSCNKEAKQNGKSWTTLLRPYYRSGRPQDAAPRSSVTMNYGPTLKYTYERDLAVKDEVLEELRRLITEEYKFKPGITLSMEECGEPNAFWRARDRRLTICYELVREFKRQGELPMSVSAEPASPAPSTARPAG